MKWQIIVKQTSTPPPKTRDLSVIQAMQEILLQAFMQIITIPH